MSADDHRIASNVGLLEVCEDLAVQLEAEKRRHAATHAEHAALRQRHAEAEAKLDHVDLVLAHARKHENANGFQLGWHAALSLVVIAGRR